MSIEQLGTDQMVWLNKYNSIDLADWRSEIIPAWDKNPMWYYVGGALSNNEPLAERKHKLECDKYHYWPKKVAPLAAKWDPKYVGSIETWTSLWKSHPGSEKSNNEDMIKFCNNVWFTKKLQPVIGGPERRKEFANDLFEYIQNIG